MRNLHTVSEPHSLASRDPCNPFCWPHHPLPLCPMSEPLCLISTILNSFLCLRPLCCTEKQTVLPWKPSLAGTVWDSESRHVETPLKAFQVSDAPSTAVFPAWCVSKAILWTSTNSARKKMVFWNSSTWCSTRVESYICSMGPLNT